MELLLELAGWRVEVPSGSDSGSDSGSAGTWRRGWVGEDARRLIIWRGIGRGWLWSGRPQ